MYLSLLLWTDRQVISFIYCDKQGCSVVFLTVCLEGDFSSVNPKGNQPCIFTGRTDAEAPILWPPDARNWLIGKDPDAGKDRRQEKGVTEDEMVGWHHWLDGHEFEQTVGNSEGQGSLACCSPWGHKEVDMTEQLNWTDLCVKRIQLVRKMCKSTHLWSCLALKICKSSQWSAMKYTV